MTKSSYSKYKIAWFPDKLQSFKDNVVLAPIYIRIKPTNRCNHNCYFCVYKSNLSKMHENANRIDEIPVNKMYEILDDISNIGVKAITFSGGGEPLFHPNINTILKQTLKNKLNLSVITNGQNLNNESAELLTQADWIRISIDYWSEESFMTSKRGNQKMFREICNNISNFIKIRTKTDVDINFIITQENFHKIQEAYTFLNMLGVDTIRFSPVWVPNFNMYHFKIANQVRSAIDFLKKSPSSTKVIDSYDKVFMNQCIRSYNKCYSQQIVPVIAADQNIYRCHNKAYAISGLIGSIKNQKFSDLWFSSETQKSFSSFNPQQSCNHECANDQKNIFITEILDCYGDNYV